MLRIRPAQLGSFKRALVLDRFEDDMVVYCNGFAPRHCEIIGDDGVRRVVRLGVDRASAYGITNPGLLRFYVHLMFCFGSRFDTDPLFPWASKVLLDPDIPDQRTRAKQLYHAMNVYLGIVAEEAKDPSIELKKLSSLRPEDFSTSDPDFEQRAIETMHWMAPNRCTYLGEDRLLAVIRRSPEIAADCAMATDRGVVLVTALMFVVGHGFASDPLHPWIEATIRNAAITSPEHRSERLQKRAQIYISQALSYFEQRRADVQQASA